MDNNFTTISKSTNVILRARKIKSGYSLFLDIHFKGQRKSEYLKLILSTNDKRKFTPSDNDKIRIAKKIQAKRSFEIAEGTYLENTIFNQGYSVHKYFQTLTNEKISNSDKSKYKWMSACNNFIKFIGKKSLAFKEVDRKFLEGFRSYLLSHLAQNTARSYFSILSEVFEKARKDKIIQMNPMSDVKSIRSAGSMKTFLTEDEFRLLCSTGHVTESGKVLFPEISKKAFIFSCFTGIRFTDIRNLKGTQVKIENGNYFLYFISAKSKKSDRMKLHKKAIEQITNIGIDKLLFPGLVTKRHINTHLRLWQEKAGIEKKITFHVAKHTFATMALNSGVDVYTLKELLHHSDIRTTEIYAKLLSKTKEEAIDKLPNF